MKKRDLLLAGLVLLNVSAFAQDEPTEPTRYKDDAKVIFVQDFEEAPKVFQKKVLNTNPKRPTTLYTWNVNPVDSIKQVKYYVKSDSVANFSIDNMAKFGEAQFEIAGTRDTSMYLYDGVVRTDAAWPDDSCLSFDSHSIVDHDDMSQRGEGLGGTEYGLDRWGEHGGTQYFRYNAQQSDGVANRAGSDGDHYVPEYRRNLFVRNIPIEEQSSYRVTVFVKPTLQATNKSIKPRLGLDLMRGYFHSEKSFMVNPFKKEAKTSWGGDTYATFNDKTDYTNLEDGKWNKITLMAYYNNDDLGAASAYLLGYYWQTDWDWKVNVDADGKVADEGTAKTLRYVQQPDKFFVRLSFRSDSTQFDVDNLSLTKSWIGGVEYSGTMARVDFGYQTNLGALAEQAKEENKIASVELPGKYFDVWGLYDSDKEDPTNELFWEKVPILSAEYQGDGFMYMWTEPWEDTGDPRIFDDYDSVLVSFTNPTDSAALMLKYTGASYPNGADSAWNADKENRLVFDFHNEIGYLNPTIAISPVTKQPVRSLSELTPVLQKLPYEDGAFGLDPKIRELTFKFSKNLSFDNLRDKAKKSQVIVIQGGTEEYWTIKDYEGDANTGWTTIQRPDEYTDDLAGDYQILFHKCTHLNKPSLDTDYSEDFIVNYHFGKFSTDARITAVSDWRSEITETRDWDRPCPPSLWAYSADDGFFQGSGKNMSPYKKVGLYKMKEDGKNGDALFYLAGRQTGMIGNLYTVESLKAGSYNISFSGFGWARNITTTMFVYAKPATMDYETLSAVDKDTLGTFKPTKNTSWSGNAAETAWPSQTERYSLDFSVPADGEYVIEWSIPREGSQSYYGVAIGNYTINPAVTGIPFGPVSSLNASLDAAQARLASASASKYKGTDYDNLESVKLEGDGFMASKIAIYENLPSDYSKEVNYITKAISALKLHMDTVDVFYKAIADAEAKLAVYADSLKEYQGFAAVDALQNTVNGYAEYNCSIQAPGQIAADTKILTDAIAAVDARQALVDKLNKAVADAQAALTTYAHLSAYSVYADVEDAIVTVAGVNKVSAEDAEIVSLTTEVDTKTKALANRDNLSKVATKRIKALDQLAKDLKAAYGDNADKAAEIAQRIANVDFDDDELANIQKAAITAALYDKIATSDEIVDSIDLTPFIKNYHLYATINGPIVDNTAKELPNSRNDAVCKAENNPGSSIMHIKHQWGQDALGKTIWVLMYGKAFDDVYPGWTVESFIANGHSMVTPDDATDKYSNLSKGTLVFDGKLTMDWNSKAELKTSVADLPAGIYALNVAVASNKSGDSKLTATADGKDYVKNMPKDNTDAKIDSIAISAGQLDIDFVLASTDGGSQADDFSLMFLGKDNSFNYAMAAQSAKEYLDNLITVVDLTEVDGAEYEYYTLNWIKVETLEKGKVYFRKLGNVVEKVIFK